MQRQSEKPQTVRRGDPLMLHFNGQTAWERETGPPEIVAGQGRHVTDRDGKRYLDALSSLYCVNVGYGEGRIVEAAASQLRTLPYAPIWESFHEPGRQLAEEIADLAPLDDAKVFFTSGGSESIESALKLVRQYHHSRGDRKRTVILARQGAYHGTTLGALSATGITAIKEQFEPLLPDFHRLPAIHPRETGLSEPEHSIELAERTRQTILGIDPKTVAAVIVEPVQNAGGCLCVDVDYFTSLRSLCDEHGILMVSDETICSWGRTGDWFGSATVGYRPDIITTAKGLTSGYIPMGCMIASGAVVREVESASGKFVHGHTFGGHPVAAAAALANINVLKQDSLLERVRKSAADGPVARIKDDMRGWPLVADVRGTGYFFALEMGVKAPDGRAVALGENQLDALYSYLPSRVRELGIITRVMNRRGPVIQFAPALTMTVDEFAELGRAMKLALAEAETLLRRV